MATQNLCKEIHRDPFYDVVREALRLARCRYRITSWPIDLGQTIWSIELSDFGNLPENWGIGHSFVSPSEISEDHAEEILLHRLGQTFMKRDDSPWTDFEICLLADD